MHEEKGFIDHRAPPRDGRAVSGESSGLPETDADWEIALPGHGVLQAWRDDAQLAFVSAAGRCTTFGDHPLLHVAKPPVHARHVARGSVLVGHIRCDRLYYFDAVRVALGPIVMVERIPLSEELRIVCAGSLFLALTENGVLAIDLAGRERWRIDQITHGWRFVGAENGHLYLADTNDNLLTFDPATGEEA